MTTAATVAHKAAELAELAKGLKDSRTLTVHMQSSIDSLALYDRRGHDLRAMDEMRAHMKRSMAHQLADELIRSGVVKFEETLVDDFHRFSKAVRITARVEVC